MNLKKILSGFLAAAMAVTTMVTANAAPITEDVTVAADISITSGTYGEDGGYEVGFDGYAWSGTWMCDDYGMIEMTFSASDWGNAKCIALVISSGDTLNDANQGTTYVQQTTWGADTGKKTYRIDCSQYAGKGFNFIGYKVYRKDDNTDTDFNGNITIESVVLAAKDTVEYEDQIIENPPMSQILPGTFDASKINGKSAKVTISWTSSDSNNGVQIQNAAGDTLAEYSGWGTIGSVTKEVLLSDFTLPEKIKLNAWGVSSIQSMTISNDKTKGKVYGYTVTVDSAIEHGTVTATPTTAAKDEKVTLTVAPATGYELDELTVKEKTSGTAVTVAEADNSFTMPDDDVTVTATFKTAEVALDSITLNKTTATVAVDGTTTLTASKVPSTTTDETPITWSSNKEDIATVSATGVVTGHAAGTAVITATCGEKTATCTVTVTENAIECTGITLDKATAKVMKNATVTLTATTTPEDTTEDITWVSSDTSIATVEDGVVTGKARGTADITVTCGTKSATCKVSVNEEETISGTTPKVFQSDVTDGKYNENDVFVISAADVAAAKSVKVTVIDNNGKKTERTVTECYKKVTYTAADGTTDTITAGANCLLAVTVTGIPVGTTVTVSIAVNK